MENKREEVQEDSKKKKKKQETDCKKLRNTRGKKIKARAS